MQKFNLHCHSAGASSCGAVSPEDLTLTYARAGYDGLVLTNHYSYDSAQEYLAGVSQRAKLKSYLDLYERARAVGRREDVHVLLGMELNLSNYNRKGNVYPVYEFLLYGLTEDFLYRYPDLYEWSQEELFDKTSEAGILAVQAHPFRPRTRVADPFLMHGIEVYNGHPGHNSHNDLAAGFAAAHPDLIVTAGDDFHQPGTHGYAGMTVPNEVETEVQLAAALKCGKCGVFVTGKTDPSIVRKNP